MKDTKSTSVNVQDVQADSAGISILKSIVALNVVYNSESNIEVDRARANGPI